VSIKLTTRQEEILELLAQGYTANEAGEKLHLSGNTIKAHIRLLKLKFGIPHCNSTRLVSLYREHYPAPDPLWRLLAHEAAAGVVREAAAVLLAHLMKHGVTTDEMAARMNRSAKFIEQLADYGTKLRCAQNCRVEPT